MSDLIFTDGTIYKRSKLGMVNDCLLVIGETPFPEGTLVENLPLGTDGQTAAKVIEDTMIEVQSRGWYFNTDYALQLVPDINGFITMPPNTLRVDFGNGPDKHRYIMKNGQIYDNLEHTFLIGVQLEADVIWLVDYDELPPEAYEYIKTRAGRKFQQRVIGSLETDKFTSRDEVDTLTALTRLQLQTQDYNLQNARVSTRIHNGHLIRGLYGNKNRRDY
jgi:hypothetical protein